MIRNFKVLGLGLVAAFAMSAVLASAASAEFSSGSTPVTLTTTNVQTQKFQVKEGGTTVECTTLTLDNSTQTTSPSTTVTVEPTYGSCKELFGQKVTVDTNGCDYVFHSNKSSTTGTTDVECPSSTGIQITVGSLCTYEIDTQTGLSSVSFTNNGSSTTGEVGIVPNVKSISSTRTTNDFPFLCPTGSSEGTYTGTSSVTGENSGNHVGVFVD